MPGTAAFPMAHKPGVEEGAQLGQGSRTMVQGQQDQARKYALVSGLEDEATFSQLQQCRLTADQHQNQMLLHAGLKIASLLPPLPFLTGYF